MVRSSFMTLSGSSRFGIEPAWLGQRRDQRAPLDVGPVHPPHQEIAVVVDVAARRLFRCEPRQISLGDFLEAVFLPAVDLHHKMARKTADQLRGAGFVEAFFLDRRGQRPHAGLAKTYL